MSQATAKNFETFASIRLSARVRHFHPCIKQAAKMLDAPQTLYYAKHSRSFDGY